VIEYTLHRTARGQQLLARGHEDAVALLGTVRERLLAGATAEPDHDCHGDPYCVACLILDHTGVPQTDDLAKALAILLALRLVAGVAAAAGLEHPHFPDAATAISLLDAALAAEAQTHGRPS
jgi:hypothetical protein